MAAGRLDLEPVAPHADAPVVDRPQQQPLEHDRRTDTAGRLSADVLDRRVHPAQITETLFSGVRYEPEVARELDLPGFARRDDRPRERDERGHGDAVVANSRPVDPAGGAIVSNGEIGACGEDGVGMRGYEQRR